jgi:hypothetical protein
LASTPTLSTRPYDAALHHPVLTEWWRARDDDDVFPIDVVPPTGVVIYDGAEPIAACSVWLMNARACYIAQAITKPDLPARLAHAAVTLAINGCVDIARKHGVKLIWAATSNNAQSRIFERAGLTKSLPCHNHFMTLDPSVAPDTLVDQSYFERKD